MGKRLGARTSAPSASVARAAPAPASSGASMNPRFEVDTTQPTTSIQVRLADGTKYVLAFGLVLCSNFSREFRSEFPWGFAPSSCSRKICFEFSVGASPFTHHAHEPRSAICGFIDAARPAGRPYTIGTTFPTCVFDPAADVRTEAGLGGVVVAQSWV
ncbi:hypothetical protein B0H14DRAFT_1155000 [Mycena olivaceomarginata]|nr:hypothetical protein B0H14DRAFT_1155000 [Mycena olivaceomarginata]